MNEQFQCPLFRLLPSELRQLIYYFALTSTEPITDSLTNNDIHEEPQLPVLGLSLPQTCRRVYQEIDIRPFYSGNRFNFVCPVRASESFRQLALKKRLKLLKELSFDMRHALHIAPLPDHTSVLRYYYGYRYAEWEHYLNCHYPISSGPCAFFQHFIDDLPSLPNLHTLVLDLVQLQRNILQSGISRDRVLGPSWHRFDGIVLALAKLAPEARVRMVDRHGEVTESVVPEIGLTEAKDDVEKAAEVKAWARRLLEGVLFNLG